MRKKTESLTFPKDPLAAMRELQNLNSSDSSEPSSDVEGRRATEPPLMVSEHPLQDAILQLLVAPYPAMLSRGPFTVTSIKIHSEIWNRVGLAATLTGRPKQEILAEALLVYLETLCTTFTNTPETPPEGEGSNPSR